MTAPFCFVLLFVFHRSHYGAMFIDSPFNTYGMHAIIKVGVIEMIENNEIYRAMENIIQRLHCTIVKMEISILYHVIYSQLNRDNVTRCYINQTIKVLIRPNVLSERKMTVSLCGSYFSLILFCFSLILVSFVEMQNTLLLVLQHNDA